MTVVKKKPAAKKKAPARKKVAAKKRPAAKKKAPIRKKVAAKRKHGVNGGTGGTGPEIKRRFSR